LTTTIQRLEKRTFEEDDSVELPPPDIIAYNELRSCADLFRMYNDRILDIQPSFQREVVWNGPKQTRFIDSLVKQLPIPSMCFSLDYRSQKWQVIDGLQRMRSIIRFLAGEQWRLSKLEDVDPALSGKPASLFLDRNSPLHQYYSRIENLTLPITVIRCDYSKTSHTNYLFTIFHRLNTGAVSLNNQEIRNCIFSGPFNDLLGELNKNDLWLRINRAKAPGGDRFLKQELILRFFAFHDQYDKYEGRLAKFLNDYMKENRFPREKFVNEKTNLFQRTVEIVYNALFGGRIPPKMTISVLEATMVGVSLNLDSLEKRTSGAIKEMHQHLLTSEEFSEEKLKEGLAGKSRVLGRMSTARVVFAGP